MVIGKTLMLITLGWVLLSAGLQGQAGEQEPCAPFLNGKVDSSRVQAMQAAAKGGHLYRIQPDTSRVGFCVDSQFAVVKAGTTIRRSDFGMDTLSQVVNDKVELCMMVAAFRYRG
jgi:hypothetical protein